MSEILQSTVLQVLLAGSTGTNQPVVGWSVFFVLFVKESLFGLTSLKQLFQYTRADTNCGKLNFSVLTKEIKRQFLPYLCLLGRRELFWRKNTKKGDKTKLIARLALAEGQNLLANISTSRGSLHQGQYNVKITALKLE